MKKLNNILMISFHLINSVLIILYLYPASIFGCFLYNDCTQQPQITRDFLISSNHFYAFMILSIFGILAYHKNKNINNLIKYLFIISIIFEFLHILIPGRSFEVKDLLGNFLGVLLIVIIYKIKKRYV
jgi:VanZ family protein